MWALRRAVCALLLGLTIVPTASARVAAGYSSGLLWPVDGALTSPFGPRPEGFHPGIDIGLLRDLTVRAAIGGRVVTAGAQTGYDGYGNVVVLSIGGGFTTIYAHLSHAFARVGEEVPSGQAIGVAGCTGWCTGTRLHFELRGNGRPMDPLSLFDG